MSNKKPLFENIDGNTFRIASPQAMGMMEDNSLPEATATPPGTRRQDDLYMDDMTLHLRGNILTLSVEKGSVEFPVPPEVVQNLRDSFGTKGAMGQYNVPKIDGRGHHLGPA